MMDREINNDVRLFERESNEELEQRLTTVTIIERESDGIGIPEAYIHSVPHARS